MMTLEIATTPSTLARLTAGQAAARRQRRPVLVSFSEAVAAGDPLTLFARGAGLAATRLYWEAPGQEVTLVGVGAAAEFPASAAERFAATAAGWQDLLAGAHIDRGPFAGQRLPGVGPTLLGGFAFDPQRPPTRTWEGFPAGLMVLPRFLLTCTAGHTALTTSLIVDPAGDPAALAAQLEAERALLFDLAPVPAPAREFDLSPGPAPARGGEIRGLGGRSLQVADVRPAAEWKAAVAGVAGDIRAGALEKVVLAREVAVTAAGPLDPAQTVRRLRAGYPDCYLFAIARGPRCFLGATPERLVRLDGGAVQATCLAGSTRRGQDAADDARLSAALLASRKDQHEHAVVVRMLSAALATVCTDLELPAAPSLLRLRNVQHLYTPIRGRLRNGTTLLELVARLHPTPAVGGYPRSAALARIRACEQLDRGWYAGPVGWVDAWGDGEFAVAIRSALLAGHTAHAFAGCGIMGDSHPDDEYAETQVKLRAVLSALEEAQA
ncbi:MAG TPA: isochorismate synthase [Chloroflexia bacterium]|nr:isochorismate synthase [Chloroflexia bacterium]